MAVYERLSSDKKCPPESRKNRRELQFGRYDYHTETQPSSDQQQQQQRSAAEVDAIVQRLRQETRRDEPPRGHHGHRTVAEAEAREIFERLGRCDFARWPVESRVGRHELGQNRYDFYRGAAAAGAGGSGQAAAPRVTRAELEAIVGRLSAYDVAKTPPNSRAQELKQKRAGGAAV